MTRAIAAVVAMLALAACGGAEPAETTHASESAVERYVSLVADHDGEWRASVSEADYACADSNEPDNCAAAYQSGSEQAQTLQSELSAAQGEGEVVPAEIAALVADTEAAAADYRAAYEAWEATECANPLDWHCGADEAFAMFEAQGELTRQLDAWKPYTG
jgi:hypothetical protein